MSREVRRVPLDFDWPLNQPWGGYLMPEDLLAPPCPDCTGGQTHAGWWLQTLGSRIEMLAADAARDQPQGRPLHPWLAEDAYPHGRWTGTSARRTFEVVRPSPDIVDLVTAIGGSTYGGTTYAVYRALVKAAGIDGWGECRSCNGTGRRNDRPLGHLVSKREMSYRSWTPTEPPTGPGWQLWETVSEGSPITPVFATSNGLAVHLVEHEGFSTAAAALVIRDGWAPSGVITSRGVFANGEGLVELEASALLDSATGGAA